MIIKQPKTLFSHCLIIKNKNKSKKKKAFKTDTIHNYVPEEQEEEEEEEAIIHNYMQEEAMKPWI